MPVWLLLGASRFIVIILPFKYLSLGLGMHQTDPWIPLIDARCETKALAIAKIVQMAARYTPWKSNCLPQAITARILLGFYDLPYSLFFGVTRDIEDRSFIAHAWVTSGRISVTGGTGFGQFTVVGCFVSAHSAIAY